MDLHPNSKKLCTGSFLKLKIVCCGFLHICDLFHFVDYGFSIVTHLISSVSYDFPLAVSFHFVGSVCFKSHGLQTELSRVMSLNGRSLSHAGRGQARHGGSFSQHSFTYEEIHVGWNTERTGDANRKRNESRDDT